MKREGETKAGEEAKAAKGILEDEWTRYGKDTATEVTLGAHCKIGHERQEVTQGHSVF